MQCNQVVKALLLDDATAAKFTPVYMQYLKELSESRISNSRKLKAKETATPENVQKTEPKSIPTDAEVEKAIKDRFAQSRKILDIREKYYNEFRKFLSPKQIQKMYNMEKRIGDKMRKEMGKRQGMKKNNNSNSRR